MKQEELEIDFYDFAVVLWKRKFWLLGIVILFTVGSVFFAKNKPDIYESKIVYHMESNTPQLNLGGVSALLGGGGVASNEFEKFEPVLNSVDLTAEFIEKNHLFNELLPEYYDSLGNQISDSKIDVVEAVGIFREKYLKYTFGGNLLTMTVKHFIDRVTELEKEQHETSLLYLNQKMSVTFVPESRRALASLITEETRKGMLIGRSRLQVIDAPRIANKKAGSKRPIIIIVGFIIGLIIGLIMIFVVEFYQSFRQKKVALND
jgi:hypothetical protein